MTIILCVAAESPQKVSAPTSMDGYIVRVSGLPLNADRSLVSSLFDGDLYCAPY
jgi:hypothetical protein